MSHDIGLFFCNNNDMFDLKIPPVLLFALAALAIGLASYFDGSLFAPPAWRLIPAFIFAVCSGLVAIPAVNAIVAAKTTINAHTPKKTTQLVTTGIYQKSRNPMYFSLLLALIALWLAVGNRYSWLGIAIYFVVITRYQIIPEERILNQLFTTQYAQYCQRVNRWWTFTQPHK